MPWAAMLHADATGARGLALRDRFAITTIPALVLLDGEGAVLCRNVHERLRDDPLGQHFPWEGTPAAARTPRVDFNLVAHSRPDAAHAWEPPFRDRRASPPPFGTVRPDPGPGPGDQGSSRQRRQSHRRGRGNTPLVGSHVGAADGFRVGLRVVQEPVPQPAPRVSPTPAPTASTPTQKTMTSKDVPRPRPPPKPGARPSPSIASRAGHALAATAAASHNMDFVPRHLAAARSDFSQGKPTSLMQPQPLSAVHPFTPP
jgi:hypothetical protein